MAEAGAVIHIVRPEALTDELLEEVGLFVAPLGRAETGKRPPAVLVADLHQARSRPPKGLLPRGLAEPLACLTPGDLQAGLFGCAVQPYERTSQAVGVVDVVKPEAALDAESVLVGRAIAPVYLDDALLGPARCPVRPVRSIRARARSPVRSGPLGTLPLAESSDHDLGLAPDPAIGAERIHRPRGLHRAPPLPIHKARLNECPGRTSLHALAASNAAALPHRVAKIKNDLRPPSAPGHPDDVVELHLAAAAQAEAALDAGIQPHRHRPVGAVGRRGSGVGRKAALLHAESLRPLPEERVRVGALGPRRLVGSKKLKDKAARFLGPRALCAHLHACHRAADAGGGKDALALHPPPCRPGSCRRGR